MKQNEFDRRIVAMCAVIGMLFGFMLSFVLGAGKVDKLMGGVFRENDVTTNTVPVQSIVPGAQMSVTTSGTIRTIVWLYTLQDHLDLNNKRLNWGGDDNTYHEQGADNRIDGIFEGATQWYWHGTYFAGASTGDPYLDVDGGSWDIQYTFQGDVDTGMKRIGANILALIAGTAGAPATNVILTGTATEILSPLVLQERTAQPSDPAEGHCVIWQSNGTGYGDDGDLCIITQAGGTLYTNTIVNVVP
jgi:hypothetical protein